MNLKDNFYHTCWLTFKFKHSRLRKKMDEVEFAVADLAVTPVLGSPMGDLVDVTVQPGGIDLTQPMQFAGGVGIAGTADTATEPKPDEQEEEHEPEIA